MLYLTEKLSKNFSLSSWYLPQKRPGLFTKFWGKLPRSNNDELGSRENEAGSTVDGSVVNEGRTENEEFV